MQTSMRRDLPWFFCSVSKSLFRSYVIYVHLGCNFIRYAAISSMFRYFSILKFLEEVCRSSSLVYDGYTQLLIAIFFTRFVISKFVRQLAYHLFIRDNDILSTSCRSVKFRLFDEWANYFKFGYLQFLWSNRGYCWLHSQENLHRFYNVCASGKENDQYFFLCDFKSWQSWKFLILKLF
jgi:hypothetical protein